MRAKLTTVPELGRWYHLAGVREQASNELRLYLDGDLVATTVGGVDGVSSGPLTVGRARYAGTKGDFWNGAIDEVRAYDRVLTAAEIAALHTSG